MTHRSTVRLVVSRPYLKLDEDGRSIAIAKADMNLSEEIVIVDVKTLLMRVLKT